MSVVKINLSESINVGDRREADDLRELVRAVGSAGSGGISLPKLCVRTSIPPSRISELIEMRYDYFVKVRGAERFALNRYGEFCGSMELILEDIERGYARTKRLRNLSFWSAMATVVFAVCLAGVLRTVSSDVAVWLPGPLILAAFGSAAAVGQTLSAKMNG